MILKKQLVREDGTIVVLAVEGALSFITSKLECSYWAEVKRPGSTEWEYHYPIRKGDKEMLTMSVDEYLKVGWGSVVKPNEVLKATIDLMDLCQAH